MRICRILQWSVYNASTREDHTGSRASEWLSEIDRRTHTCLMDASIHVHTGRSRFSQTAAGSETSIFYLKNLTCKVGQ